VSNKSTISNYFFTPLQKKCKEDEDIDDILNSVDEEPKDRKKKKKDKDDDE